MAGPLAEATADIRLSDGKFNTDLATILAKLRSAVTSMERDARVDLTATIKVDDTLARQTVAGFHDETAALGDINVDLTVRTEQIDQARQALESLRVATASLSEADVTIRPTLQDQQVIESVGRLQDILTALGSESPMVTIGLNATETLASLELVNAELDKLAAKRVDVNLSADGVAKTTAEIEAADAAAGAAASDSGGFGRLATRLGFFAVAGVTAIGALGAKITELGVTSAASIESTVNSFTNILGSAQQANALFSQLQAFSIPAPFDTIVLANTAKQLLAIGDNVKQVVPDVKTLAGAVALLGNQDPAAFEKLTLALGQIGSSVKVNLQDIRQVSQALPGFNAQQQLAAGAAAQLGITTEEAAKQIKDGSVAGAEAMRILLEQMKAFPGASTAIASAADTLKGKLSAFKDVVKLDLIGSFSGLTSQLKDSLLPLSDSLDVAFKAIGPQLSSALSSLLPAVGPFVEQLGQALAPAFGGIFTGLGGVLQGLTPVLASVLPVVGELAKSFGDLAAAAGPGIAQTAGVIGDVFVPALQSVADVVKILSPLVGPLLTGFLAFKAIDGITGVFDRLGVSAQGAATKLSQIKTSALGGFGSAASSEDIAAINANLSQVNEAGSLAAAGFGTAATAASGFQRAVSAVGPAVVGIFSGIALSSEDMSTRVLGAVGAVSSVVTQLAAGNVVGAAFTAGATVVGTLIGKFEEGSTKAAAFQKAVESLAGAIKNELKLGPGDVPDLGEIVTSQAFGTEFENTLGTKLRGALVHAFSLKDSDVKAALQGTQAQFDAFIDQFVAKADSAGKVISLPKFELLNADDQGALVARLTKLRDLAVADQQAIKDSQDASAGSTDAFAKAVANSSLAILDADSTFSLFNGTVTKVGNSFQGQIDAVKNSVSPVKDLNQQYADLASSLYGLSPAFAAFAQNVNVDAALDRVKQAASDLKDTFTDLTSALSQSISNQNLQAQLDGLATSLDSVIGQDKFEAAKQRADSISGQLKDQQDRIADLKASLAEAQAKALQDAADLDVRIADARAHGSVTGLAALEAARANVNDGADKAQRDLDKAERTIGDLQNQLAGIDVTTPQKLIDTVKAQAKTAGVDLWTFLLQGPTAEARQLYQQDLAAVVNSAFTNIQQTDDKQGPQAALDLVTQIQGTLHDQLVKGGFSPGTADEIVQNMLHPDELTKSLTDELSANLNAATAAASKDATVNIGANTTDIEAALTKIRAEAAVPIVMTLTTPGGNLTPPSSESSIPGIGSIIAPKVIPDLSGVQGALDLVDSHIVAQVVPGLAGVQSALDLVNGQLPAVVVPDDSHVQDTLDLHAALLTTQVVPDFEPFDKQIGLHISTATAAVQPDTTLLDQIFSQPRAVTAKIIPDLTAVAALNQQLVLSQIGVAVPAADGGIFEFFRNGGFSRSALRDAAHVAQIAPAGAWRVWAEPETGGEGYVPLALSKRERSTEIVRTIADMFGYRLEPKIDINPTIDVFPAVSPVVNLHPTFTMPVLSPQMRTENRSLASVAGIAVKHSDQFERSLVSDAATSAVSLVSSVVLTLVSTVKSFVQSLLTDSPSPSRPAVTSVAHMTGWTTAPLSPSWVRLVAGDPKIPDLGTVANRMSPWSVPSMFEHDIPASPSPVGSQLVVWGSVPREALPPGATGGPAHVFSSLFDTKTLIGPTVGGFTAIVGRVLSSDGEFPHTTREAPAGSIFHQTVYPNQAAPTVNVNPQAAGGVSLYVAGPDVSTVASMFAVDRPAPNVTLNPELAVKVTTSPDSELAAAVRELTQMLRSGSPHAERLARAESIARHIHVHEGAITLTSDKPRQSARELVDELTRMAY